MKRNLFYPAVLLLGLVCCRPQENPDQLNAVNRSLERANKAISDENNLSRQHFLNMQKDPQTASITTKLVQTADRINQKADSIQVVIKGLKDELMKESDSLKREYVTVVKQLYDDNGVGNQLLKKLAAFKDSIPAIIYGEGGMDAQSYMRKDINHLLDSVPLLPGYGDSLSREQRIQYGRKWLNESFGRSSSLMAMIMLNKIENDVLTTEKMVMEYCNNNIAIDGGLRYDKIESIAYLSSSYVKRGQTINVRAGIGLFSSASKPTITIDGKVIPLNEDATTMYNFNANGNPGIHTIAVKIEYTKPDGTTAMKIHYLEYIIADEK